MKLNRTTFRGSALLFCATLYLIGSSSTSYADQATTTEDTKKPITLGFFPIVSSVALFKRFSPLRDYLSESLGQPVALQTARNFPTFLQRTDERRYDIVVTAPHFAVRAADSGDYIIRATLIKDVQQLFVVKKDSHIQNIEEFAGKTLATPPKQALMTMMGIQYLNDIGLVGNKHPKLRAYTSHNAANQSVLAGEVDGAIASSNLIYKAIKRGEPIRILKGGNQLPNMALLVASDRNTELGDKVTKILINMKKSDKGRAVLKQISLPGYRAVTAKDYEPARPYMEQVVKKMALK